MKHFFGLLFRALILVTVALVCALTAMRFAIHGREVAVPKFIGLTPTEADRAAFASGLTLQIENRFYSTEVAAGRILNQVPEAGEKVRRGWRVRVAESMGPQRVSVPNVVGQSERAAEINLIRRGLQVGTVTTAHFPDTTPDTVVAQSPSADAEGVSSPKVNLVIARYDPDAHAIVMPDLVGRSLDDATRVLVSAGMRVGKISTVTNPQTATAAPPAQPGVAQAPPLLILPIVVRQAPAAGQKAVPNVGVNLDVVR
jgi:eukaryotic-like serine/threonine-protein kinase